MAKRKENSWQFKFSSILAGVMLFLIIGYFVQSYNEVRKMKPVQAAIEHVSSTKQKQSTESGQGSAEDVNE